MYCTTAITHDLNLDLNQKTSSDINSLPSLIGTFLFDDVCYIFGILLLLKTALKGISKFIKL